jgi:Na+-driven multidrug efflux pump
MVLTAVFMAVNHIQGGALASAAQMWAGVMANLSWAVALLTFAFLLVPGKGALGLAWATLLSYPLQSLVLWLSLRRNVLLASKKT